MHEMGVETHCFSNVKPDYIHETVDYFYSLSIFDKDTIVSICKEKNVTGVIATTELTISIAAYVAQKLNSPELPYDVSLVINDKFRNREECKNVHLLQQPLYMEICKEEDLDKITDFPAIVKPTSNGGKQGITVVFNSKELLSAYEIAKGKSRNSKVVVEKYIEGGKEYSVESLSYKGRHYIIQVTEKISSGAPHCVELGHKQPADLSPLVRKEVEQAIIEGLQAIGIDNTSCHTEIKIIDDIIYLIEFNARPGGDHIAWPLTTLSTGYEYIKGAINIALGAFKEVDVRKLNNHYAGVYFVTKQTAFLKPLFDTCEKYDWLYKKYEVSSDLQLLEHNDCYNTNSIMYYSENVCPDIYEIACKVYNEK